MVADGLAWAMRVIALVSIAALTRSVDVQLRRRGVLGAIRISSVLLGLAAAAGVLVVGSGQEIASVVVVIWLAWSVVGIALLDRTTLVSPVWRLLLAWRELQRSQVATEGFRGEAAGLAAVRAGPDPGPSAEGQPRAQRAERRDELVNRERAARTHMLEVLATLDSLRNARTSTAIDLLQEAYGLAARLEPASTEREVYLREALPRQVELLFPVDHGPFRGMTRDKG